MEGPGEPDPWSGEPGADQAGLWVVSTAQTGLQGGQAGSTISALGGVVLSTFLANTLLICDVGIAAAFSATREPI